MLTAPFKGIAKDIKKQGGFVKSFLRGLQGAGKYTDAAMLGFEDEVKRAADYDDLFEEDKKLIMRKMGQSNNNLLIYKMIDYQGKFYKGRTVTKAEFENFMAFNEGNRILAEMNPQETEEYQKKEEEAQKQQVANQTQNQETQQTQQSTTQQATDQQNIEKSQTQFKDSFEYKLTKMILEAQNLANDPSIVGAPVASDVPEPQPEQPKETEEQPTEKESQYAKELEAYKRVCDLYDKNRKNFYVYYIQTSENIKPKASVYDREVTKLNNTKRFPNIIVDPFFQRIKNKVMNFTIETGNEDIIKYFIENIKYLKSGENARKIGNRFAICFGVLGQRKIWMDGSQAIQAEGEGDKKKEIENLSKEFNKKEQEILKDFLGLNKKWRKNLYLKYHKLDIEDMDGMRELLGALDKLYQQKTAKDERKPIHKPDRQRGV